MAVKENELKECRGRCIALWGDGGVGGRESMYGSGRVPDGCVGGGRPAPAVGKICAK